MAMKPEPMDYDGELDHGSNAGSNVFPMQLVQNENRTTSENHYGDHISSESNVQQEPRSRSQQSAVSEILLSKLPPQSYKIKGRQSNVPQPYSVKKGELELNSKDLPKKFKCGMCIYKTSYKSDLNRHMRRHLNNKEVPFCGECNLTFSSQSSLKFHQMKCPFKGISVPMEIITPDGHLKCEICPYVTSYRSDLNRHMKGHFSNEYACNICMKPFKVMTTVDGHRLKAHGITQSIMMEGPESVRNPYFQQAGLSGATNSQTEGQTVEYSSHNFYNPTVHSNAANSQRDEQADVHVRDSSPTALLELMRRPDILPRRPLIPDTPNQFDSGRTSFTQSSPGLAVPEIEPNVVKQEHDPSLNTLQPIVVESEIQDVHPQPSVSQTQIQRQSRVRELLSLNSGRQPTVTLSIKQFCCEKCSGVFPSVKELLKHKKSCCKTDAVHVRLYKCNVCAFKTWNNKAFKRHKRKHSTASFNCTNCKKPFLIERNLLKHKTLCRQLSLTTNAQCQRSSESTVRMDEDTTMPGKVLSSTTRVVKGNECQLPNSGEIPRHPRQSRRYAKLVSDFDEFAQKPYACALCFFRASRLLDLSQHVENHLTGCNQEAIQDTASFAIVKQEENDSDGQPLEYIIEQNESYSVRQNPNSRLRTKYQPNPPSFHTSGVARTRFVRCQRSIRDLICPICSKQFSLKTLLQRHITTMHGGHTDNQ